MTISVLLADDHRLVRTGLLSLVNASSDCRVVAEAADGVEAHAQILALQPDVAVLDLNMPRLGGLELARKLQPLALRTRLLVLTMHEEQDYVLQLVQLGAAGYLLKDSAAEELLAAIRALASGRQYYGSHALDVLTDRLKHPVSKPEPLRELTAREREVFMLLTEGLSTKKIASQLSISVKTAENHRSRILAKMDLHNTVELVRAAARMGLLEAR